MKRYKIDKVNRLTTWARRPCRHAKPGRRSKPMKVNTAVAAILLTTAAVTGVVAQTPQPTMGSQQPAPPPAAPFGTPIAAELAQRIADAATAKAREIGVPSAVAVVEPTGDL